MSGEDTGWSKQEAYIAVAKKADRTDVGYSCRTEPPKIPRLE